MKTSKNWIKMLMMAFAMWAALTLHADYINTPTTSWGQLKATNLQLKDTTGLYRVIDSITRPTGIDILGDLSISSYLGSSTVKSDIYTIWCDSIYGTVIGSFSGCSNITSVSIYNHYQRPTYYSVWMNITNIVDGAFKNCTSIKTASTPNTVTKGPCELYSGCTSLQQVTHSFTTIGDQCFYGCTNLSAVDVSNISSIGRESFWNCASIESLTFGGSLNKIGGDAFYGASGLKTLSFNSQPPAGILKSHILDYVAPANVSYPASSAEAWKTTLVLAATNNAVVITGDQEFPWNGLIDLECFINSDVTDSYSLAFEAFDVDGGTNIPMRTVWSEGGAQTNATQRFVSHSTNRFVWNAGADLPAGFYSTNIAIRISGRTDVMTPVTVDMRQGPVVISSKMRATDSTIMDIVYRVNTGKTHASVRALAFQEGKKNWSYVLRPEDWIEGTDANLGASILANRDLKLSWRVSSDWGIDLSKVSIQVLAVTDDPLPVAFKVIPATANHDAVRYSCTSASSEQIMKVLYWAYAGHFEGLTLTDGELKYNGTTIACGTGIVNLSLAVECAYKAAGYDVLDGDLLDYVNSVMRLNLTKGSGLEMRAVRVIKN